MPGGLVGCGTAEGVCGGSSAGRKGGPGHRASKGIGRHVAEHLAAEGTGVAITARTPGPLELTAEEIQSATGRRVLVLAGDMSLAPDVARCVAATQDRLGPIDILVTCAGNSPDRDGAQRKAIMD